MGLVESKDPSDRAVARQALEEAVSLGHPKAAYQLGMLLTNPPFLDFRAARDAFSFAAEHGHAKAAYELGRLLQGGLRHQTLNLPSEKQVPVDLQEACAAYAKAASAGDARAAWALAHCQSRIWPRDCELLRHRYMEAMRADPGRTPFFCSTMMCGPRDVEKMTCFVDAAARTGNWKPLAAELAHIAKIGPPGRNEDAAFLLKRLLASVQQAGLLQVTEGSAP